MTDADATETITISYFVVFSLSLGVYFIHKFLKWQYRRVLQQPQQQQNHAIYLLVCSSNDMLMLFMCAFMGCLQFNECV